LDLSRPLWEMYVIEGLDNIPGVPGGSYAIFTKLHHAAVDGHSMRDIVSGIHDLTPDLEDSKSGVDWAPEHRPGSATPLRRAVVNNLVRAPFRTGRAGMKLLPSAAGAAVHERCSR
jgi:diacylglycerol O-acyltransferase